MRLKVEIFSTFQRKVRRRTAHQCHTRPRQVARAAPLHAGAPAAVLPAALCQGDFEAYTFLETRLVCFSPYFAFHIAMPSQILSVWLKKLLQRIDKFERQNILQNKPPSKYTLSKKTLRAAKLATYIYNTTK